MIINKKPIAGNLKMQVDFTSGLDYDRIGKLVLKDSEKNG